jgi:hypothetical protein
MLRQLRHVVVLALSAIILGPGIVRAQTLEDPQELLAAYAAIVQKYRAASGDAAAELLALGRLRLKTLDAVMGQARHKPALLRPRPGRPRLLRAAAMLHSDIAFQGAGRATTGVSPARRRSRSRVAGH